MQKRKLGASGPEVSLIRPFLSSIIAGATTPDPGGADAAAVDWALSPADLSAIDSITL